MNRNRRKAFLVSAVLVGGALLMTACSQGDDAAGAGGAGSSAGAIDAAAAKKTGAKGVSGTFAGGTVEYVAPGKYVVSVPGKGDQEFWIADDTEIYGAGTVCGDAGSKVDAPCTEANLEAATKGGRSVKADVVMKDGAATRVTERRSSATSSGGDEASGSGGASGSGDTSGSGETVVEGLDKGKGVNGTWYGIVRFVAPGKYEVSGASAKGSGGASQLFHIAEDTEIWGGGEICGDPDDAYVAAAKCTEADLEATGKGGVEAEVVIENGIATKITDGALG